MDTCFPYLEDLREQAVRVLVEDRGHVSEVERIVVLSAMMMPPGSKAK